MDCIIKDRAQAPLVLKSEIHRVFEDDLIISIYDYLDLPYALAFSMTNKNLYTRDHLLDKHWFNLGKSLGLERLENMQYMHYACYAKQYFIKNLKLLSYSASKLQTKKTSKKASHFTLAFLKNKYGEIFPKNSYFKTLEKPSSPYLQIIETLQYYQKLSFSPNSIETIQGALKEENYPLIRLIMTQGNFSKSKKWNGLFQYLVEEYFNEAKGANGQIIRLFLQKKPLLQSLHSQSKRMAMIQAQKYQHKEMIQAMLAAGFEPVEQNQVHILHSSRVRLPIGMDHLPTY